MVLLSVQGMTSPRSPSHLHELDRVREVINNFNADGFDSLYPRYAGGRPPVFTLPQRQQIKKIALSRPADHGLPFSNWSLAKLAEFLVAEGWVDDIFHEGLRELLVREEVSFQAVKTWKHPPTRTTSRRRTGCSSCTTSPRARPSRGDGDPTVVFSMDEFGPLNLMPARSPVGTGRFAHEKGDDRVAAAAPHPGDYKRTKGVRHLLAALDMNRDHLYGHVKKTKNRTEVPRLLPLPAQPLPAQGADRHRL